MYCNNCGKQIDKDSTFCQFCGHKIATIDPTSHSKVTSHKENGKPRSSKTKKDLLWDKFAEVYDAKDDDREQFDRLSSEAIWELIERLYTNAFETFIQEKKKDLNPQPYKAIESLKNLYLYAVLGGYRLWIAEALLDGKELGKFKSFDIDKFVEEWKAYDFQKAMKGISDEMGVCMSMYLEHRMSILMENAPSIKDLSNTSVEELRNSITFQIINGYLAGEVESKFRK